MLSGREKMPFRRTAETVLVDHTWSRGSPAQQTETMTVTIGRYADGRIGEVFVDCDNHLNERAIGLWHDIGIIVSIALQRGATLTELSAAMARGDVNVLGQIVEVPHSPAGTLLAALVDMEARDRVEQP
jgi:hypothetical protein